MTIDIEKLRTAIPVKQPRFTLKKPGHVVIKVTDLQRSRAFYAGMLGFKVSDTIGEDMMPSPADKQKLHHFALAVGMLDDVFCACNHLRENGARTARTLSWRS